MLGDASEVCIFCHTPGLSASVPMARLPSGKTPAWQKAVSQSLEFAIYDDLGRSGKDMLSVGSQSVACLSCHDGLQAPTIFQSRFDHPYGVPYRGAINDSRSRSGHWLMDIGSELPFPELPFSKAKHLVALEDFRDLSQGVIDGRVVFWVSRSGNAQRRTRSDLPVYVRQQDGTAGSAPYIECSSCHDPHTENESFLRISNSGGQLCLTCHIK